MKKRVLSALLALCLTLSLAGAAFAENEPSGDSSSAVSQAVSSVESEPQTQNETVSSGSASGEDQTTAKTESTPAPTQTPAASDVTEEEEPESTVAPEATEEPEATAEPDATPAPTEDPEAEVTEKTETDGSVEYTAALETDGETMNVIVTAPEGAFAQDVQPELSVTMLTAEDELNDVADKLDTAKVQYDGFTALDITFTDKATGEEIEPVKEVSVRIELPQAMVDSGIDLTTLAVQHLEEDENGNVNVAEVATLDNGITLSEEAAAAANEAAGVAPMSDMPAEEATAADAAETPAAVAEFDVDGFSRFTITWQDTNNNTSTNISVVLWNAAEDEELNTGGDIQSQFSKTLDDGEIYSFTDSTQVPAIDGYTFDHAEYGWKYGNYWQSLNNDVKSVSAKNKLYWSDGFFGIGAGWKNNWIYSINGREVDSGGTIRLYYVSEGSSENPGQTVTPEPGHEKTVVWNAQDNAYDLTLTVNGTVGSQTTPAMVDVLMIVDTSGSMNDYGRLQATKNAMNSLVNTLDQKENVSVRYNIVKFAKNASGVTSNQSTNGWVTNANEKVTNAINGLHANDGTNYEAGLSLAIEKLKYARSDAQTVVIFLSDGKPTYSLKGGNGSTGLLEWVNGYGQPYKKYWDDTLNTAKGLTCSQFYTIGISGISAQDDMDQYLDKSNTGLLSAVNSNTTEENYKKASYDGSNLTSIFNQIAESSVELNVTNVKITDKLSEYVEPVLGANSQPEKLEVMIRDKQGQTVNNDFGITAQYNATSRELSLVFPADYALNSDYTYSVILSVLPSSTAELSYAKNGGYPTAMKGEEGTGDHAGQSGFYSNDGPAKLTYRYPNDTEDRTADYKMPVVQVKKSYLSLGKALGENTTVGENETFTFEIGIPAEDAGTYDAQYTSQANVQSLTFKQEEGQSNATATVTLKANEQIVIVLPTGTQATVKETTTEGYTQAWYEGQTSLTPNVDGIVSVDLSSTAGQKSTIVCVNTVENVTGKLSITKKLVDEKGQDLPLPSGELSKSFKFTVTAEGGLAEAVSGQSYKAENASETDKPVLVFGEMSDEGTNPPVAIGQMTVTVSEGSNTGSFTVADLPAGLYTIAESGTIPSVTGYHWSDVAYNGNYNSDNVSANVEKDKQISVEITNKYEHDDVTLTISKKVLGSMGDTSGDFHFVLTLKDGNETYKESIGKDDETLSYTEADPENDITAGYHFTLSDGDTTTFTIPYGLSANVVEQTGDGYRTYCRDITATTPDPLPTSDEDLEKYFKDQGNKFGTDTGDITMNGNKAYQFINFRPVVAPTGLEDNHTKPFGLMVGVAVMAGLALVGGAVVRRRRRWME